MFLRDCDDSIRIADSEEVSARSNGIRLTYSVLCSSSGLPPGPPRMHRDVSPVEAIHCYRSLKDKFF